MPETWYDDNYKYEVELIKREAKPNDEEVKEFILTYKVLTQEKRKKTAAK